MRAIEKYVRSHPRHFRQQSDYTICAGFDKSKAGWQFHPHGPVFGNRGKQDFLWKFNIPSSERCAGSMSTLVRRSQSGFLRTCSLTHIVSSNVSSVSSSEKGFKATHLHAGLPRGLPNLSYARPTRSTVPTPQPSSRAIFHQPNR